jgi:3',5'-cyclic AMP phosphodiesterase CpdA
MTTSNLPIPDSQLHYADPAINDEAQTSYIEVFVNHLQYPTLGAPALLTPEQSLRVVVSLPAGEDPGGYSGWLVPRHESEPNRADIQLPIGDEDAGYKLSLPESQTGKAGGQLTWVAAPTELGLGPAGKLGRRSVWLLQASVAGFAPRLYDLSLRKGAEIIETQHNAVRIFAQITGRERVIFCGDSQFHEGNEVCLDRFIERMNSLHGIAWVALIGDICDNGVRSPLNVVGLATSAGPEPVRTYYSHEFAEARRRLARLNKPIVLVPGNHDGMCAYAQYSEGAASPVYLGPETGNPVAYDGLHYFRRTFGPLYFGFDWHRTRYLCANSFELDRHQRLGYHCVVANWGGWMREEQVGWLRTELEKATAAQRHKVMLIQHDPRGGSMGKYLGQYNEYREYRYQDAGRASLDYLKYFFTHIQRFQQEWMRPAGIPLAEHPVRQLLSLLLEHKVWSVIMGHDNENWMESYDVDGNIFETKPVVHHYAPKKMTETDPELVRDIADLLADGRLEEALRVLKERTPDNPQGREDVLAAAVARMAALSPPAALHVYGASAAATWGLRAQAPIHFTHVNDVGGYSHSSDKDFGAYGYVVAQLDEGRPVNLQGYTLRDDSPGPLLELVEG